MKCILGLSAALYRLPDLQREEILSKRWQVSSVAEIARNIDRSVPAVASLLRRGLASLRKHLLDAGEGP